MAYFLTLGVLILLIAAGLWTGRRWLYGAAVFIELIALGLTWEMLTERFWIGAVLTGVRRSRRWLRCSAGTGAPRSVGNPLLVHEQVLPQLRERSCEQPGHMHLGDADLRRDLRLRHAPEEPEKQDLLLPRQQLFSSGFNDSRYSTPSSDSSSSPSVSENDGDSSSLCSGASNESVL